MHHRHQVPLLCPRTIAFNSHFCNSPLYASYKSCPVSVLCFIQFTCPTPPACFCFYFFFLHLRSQRTEISPGQTVKTSPGNTTSLHATCAVPELLGEAGASNHRTPCKHPQTLLSLLLSPKGLIFWRVLATYSSSSVSTDCGRSGSAPHIPSPGFRFGVKQQGMQSEAA